MSIEQTRQRRDALPMQTRAVPVESVDAEARTVEVVWTTGAAVRRRRYDWDSGKVVDYDEILVVSSAAIDLSRLERGAPVLDSHSTWRASAQLAVVERAWIEAGRGLATIRFPAAGIDEEIDKFFSLVMDGQRRNISVGYSVDTVRKEVDEKNGTIEKWFVERWTPFEISFVTIGADMDAQVRQRREADGERSFPVQFISNRAEPEAQEGSMPNPVDKAAGAAAETATPTDGQRSATDNPVVTPPAPVVDGNAVRIAVQAEQARVAELMPLRSAYPAHAALIDEAIGSGATVSETKLRIFEKMREESDKNPTRSQVETGGNRQDETETRREAMTDYLLHRSRGGLLPERAREFRGMRLLDVAREVLAWNGESVRGQTPDEIAVRSLHSTSDFPAILANVVNRTLRATYTAAPQTFRPFTRQIPLTDFKTVHIVRRGLAPQLEKVGENGEFARGTIAESKEEVKLSTYGRVVGVTRQVIVNDDLGALTSIPADFGQSASTLESDLVWGIILSNPVLKDDSTALFHTAKHKNLASSGTALSADAIGIGRTAMRKQVDLDGVTTLNITPGFLLLPPELETVGEKILATFIAAKAADVTPESIRSLTPIVEARLSNGINKPKIGLGSIAGSATAFYLASAMVDTVVWATLEGNDGPYVESRMGFDVDGVEIKCRHDFGAAAADFRGLYKDPGAAQPS